MLDELLEKWTELMTEFGEVYDIYILLQDRLILDELDGEEFEDEYEYEDVLFEYNMFEDSLMFLIEDLEHLEAVIEIFGGTVPTLDDDEDDAVVCKHCQCHCS